MLASSDVAPMLKAHQKTCGGMPLRVARVKRANEPAPPLQAAEFIDGVVDRLMQGAGEMLKKGVADAVKRHVGKRR